MIIYMEETTNYLQAKGKLPKEVYESQEQRETSSEVRYIVI